MKTFEILFFVLLALSGAFCTEKCKIAKKMHQNVIEDLEKYQCDYPKCECESCVDIKEELSSYKGSEIAALSYFTQPIGGLSTPE